MPELVSQQPRILILLVIAQNVILFLLTVGIYLLGTLVLRAMRGKSASGYSLSPLGFQRPRGGYLAGVSVGVLVGFGVLLMSAVLISVSSLVLESLGLPAENRAQQPLMQGVANWVGESPAVAIPLSVFAIVLLGPAVEELVFRGAIFGGLYRLFGLAAERGVRSRAAPAGPEATSSAPRWFAFALAAVLSSILFSLLHLSPVVIVAFFVLAIVLCELFRRTGSLLTPFVAHATFNSFTTIGLILMGLDVVQM